MFCSSASCDSAIDGPCRHQSLIIPPSNSFRQNPLGRSASSSFAERPSPSFLVANTARHNMYRSRGREP